MLPAIPLLETINADPDHDTMPALWATVEFTSFNETAASLGSPSCRRETGTIIVQLSVESGEGDGALMDAATLVQNAYRYWQVTDLRVTQVDPPISDYGFSVGRWYSMSMDIAYDYDRYI